jgi:hypothetical protein
MTLPLPGRSFLIALRAYCAEEVFYEQICKPHSDVRQVTISKNHEAHFVR